MNPRMMKKVLVIGCGGTGSEIIKLLRLSECEVTCVDYDVVETSNCSRQFYFTVQDVYRSKAEVIAEKTGCRFFSAYFECLEIRMEDFDCVIACVDNMKTRMEINYQFVNCRGNVLLDLGVEDLFGHVKVVRRNTSCLYCIKELFPTTPDFSVCSMSSALKQINERNREYSLKHFVYARKEKNKATVEEIVDDFNSMAAKSVRPTNYTEVETLYHNIVPNTCVINSILASTAIHMLFNLHNDYIFYNGKEGIYFNSQKIESDENCFICKKRKR